MMKHYMQLMVLTGLAVLVTISYAQENNTDTVRNVNVTAGDDIYLQWINEDVINVYWNKDGIPITDQDGRIFIIPTHGLLILTGDLIDQGFYTCMMVTRQFQVMERVFKVDVSRPMNLTRSIEEDNMDFIRNLTVIAGEDLHLEWLNQNPSHVIWIKDNLTIVNSAVAGRDGRFVTIPELGLLVLNSDRGDSGNYTCVVITSQNTVRKQGFWVDVTDQSMDFDGNSGNDVCGYPRVRGKIVGGRISEHGQSPWMAMLWSNDLRSPVCGGVLLNQRWIVTAAHCFSPPVGLNSSDMDSFEVRLGEHRVTEDDGTELIVRLKAVIINPNFDWITYDSDIALLQLQQPLTYTDYISPLCLPNEIQAHGLVTPGTKGIVTGWGDIVENGAYSRKLKRVRLSIISQHRCRNLHHMHKITTNMICTNPGTRDACDGDSGGPLAVKDDAKWYLVGLVSWGIGCARSWHPGVYTRVNRFKQWIDDTIHDGDVEKSEANMSEWSAWGACSVSCGNGMEYRNRTCLVNETCFGLKDDVSNCTLPDCSNMSEWSAWGACSVSCGNGMKYRNRTCSVNETCFGLKDDVSNCTLPDCLISASWSSWDAWGSCSRSCGGGTRYRSRNCQGVGQCPGSNKSSESCNTRSCPSWSSWVTWGSCSRSCGGGTRYRSRNCQGIGSCPGSAKSSENCNTRSCPHWSSWGLWGFCDKTCGGGTRTRFRSCFGFGSCFLLSGSSSETGSCNTDSCPHWSSWGLWGFCDKTCGGGTRTRSRSCLGYGSCFLLSGSSSETESCNSNPCPHWSFWGSWGYCDRTCGGGTRSRSRSCSYGSCFVLFGSSSESERCNTDSCPSWSSWGMWGMCDRECGGGTRSRSRICYGIFSCFPGSSSESESCNTHSCSSNGWFGWL